MDMCREGRGLCGCVRAYIITVSSLPEDVEDSLTAALITTPDPCQTHGLMRSTDYNRMSTTRVPITPNPILTHLSRKTMCVYTVFT